MIVILFKDKFKNLSFLSYINNSLKTVVIILEILNDNQYRQNDCIGNQHC